MLLLIWCIYVGQHCNCLICGDIEINWNVNRNHNIRGLTEHRCSERICDKRGNKIAYSSDIEHFTIPICIRCWLFNCWTKVTEKTGHICTNSVNSEKSMIYADSPNSINKIKFYCLYLFFGNMQTNQFILWCTITIIITIIYLYEIGDLGISIFEYLSLHCTGSIPGRFFIDIL